MQRGAVVNPLIDKKNKKSVTTIIGNHSGKFVAGNRNVASHAFGSALANLKPNITQSQAEQAFYDAGFERGDGDEFWVSFQNGFRKPAGQGNPFRKNPRKNQWREPDAQNVLGEFFEALGILPDEKMVLKGESNQAHNDLVSRKVFDANPQEFFDKDLKRVCVNRFSGKLKENGKPKHSQKDIVEFRNVLLDFDDSESPIADKIDALKQLDLPITAIVQTTESGKLHAICRIDAGGNLGLAKSRKEITEQKINEKMSGYRFDRDGMQFQKSIRIPTAHRRDKGENWQIKLLWVRDYSDFDWDKFGEVLAIENQKAIAELPPNSNSPEAMRAIEKSIKGKFFKDRLSGGIYLKLEDNSPLWTWGGKPISPADKGYMIPIGDDIVGIVRAWAINKIEIQKGKSISKFEMGFEAFNRFVAEWATPFKRDEDYNRKSSENYMKTKLELPDVLSEIWPDIIPATQGDIMSRNEAEWLVKHALKSIILGQIALSVQAGYPIRTSVVLAGKQQAGKRTFINLIAPTLREAGIWSENQDETLSSSVGNIAADLKTLAEKERGMKVMMIGEMQGIHDDKGGALEALKDYMTATFISYRPPYARTTIKQYRTCIFIGKTNRPASAVPCDSTGNTRWLPLNIGDRSNDPKKILTAEKRRMLFGIGWRMWEAGERPDFPRDKMYLLERLAQRHSPADRLLEVLEEITADRDQIPAKELRDALAEQGQKYHTKALSDAMQSLGFEQKLIGKKRQRIWIRQSPSSFEGRSGDRSHSLDRSPIDHPVSPATVPQKSQRRSGDRSHSPSNFPLAKQNAQQSTQTPQTLTCSDPTDRPITPPINFATVAKKQGDRSLRDQPITCPISEENKGGPSLEMAICDESGEVVIAACMDCSSIEPLPDGERCLDCLERGEQAE